jgi:RNA polymerase sigma-70 factor (ECF subfamily)
MPHPIERTPQDARPNDPTDERAIIAGCRAGRPEAQRALFDRYKDRVHSIALHYLRGDDAAAKDVTQEVFVKVFRAAANFREDATMATYLYRAVVNACTDELRRRRRLVLMGDLPVTMHPQTEQSAPREEGGRVSEALKQLSPKLRLVVLMRYFDDLSYEEIAAAIGVSSGTVASRLNRARAQLSQLLGGSPDAGGMDD